VADPVTRAATRWAAAIALPVALVAGFVAYRILNGSTTGPAASPSPAPQATTPVPMAAPALPATQATACQLLVSRLPESVRDRPRRPVTAGPKQNAAYGDPAITLACGGAPTASVEPTATVYNLSGVCWYPVTGQAATTWQTVDRQVPVTVTVPDNYDAQAQWVVAFSPAIAGTIHATTTGVPTGCSN
jgi:Protein of unknown function (DUF3515)